MSNIVPFNELQVMAKSVTMSGMFGLKNENQALTLMLIAQAENIHPVQAVQMYSIINGMPALKTTEMISRYNRAGGKIVWVESTATNAKAKFVFDGEELVFEYTIEDAKRAGYTDKDNWKRMPKEMLRARCASSGIRMSNPSCLNNMYSVEEAIDMPKDPQDMSSDYIVDAVIENETPSRNYKREMMDKLKSYGLTKAMITEFAKMHNLVDDAVCEKLLNDNQELEKLIKEYEK